MCEVVQRVEQRHRQRLEGLGVGASIYHASIMQLRSLRAAVGSVKADWRFSFLGEAHPGTIFQGRSPTRRPSSIVEHTRIELHAKRPTFQTAAATAAKAMATSRDTTRFSSRAWPRPSR